MTSPTVRSHLAPLLAAFLGASATAQCPTEPTLQNWTGAGQVTCPCFIVGEEAGVVLDAPAAHYPIEILRIQVGWGSQFGGAPQSLEQALHVYAGALPNPGTPQFSLPAPVLTDGFINEFNIEFTPGNRIINSGPFTVTLEFANASTLFGASLVHDGNGCQAGKNAVKAIPGGWSNSCVLGVTGDWQMGVVYRRVNCPGSTPASCTLRNGTGINPAVYTCVTTPKLGTTWVSNIQTVAGTTSTSIALAPGGPIAPLPIFGGEILINLSPPPVFVPGLAPGTQILNIPVAPALMGAPLATQGFRIDLVSGTPTLVILNAQDLVLGN